MLKTPARLLLLPAVALVAAGVLAPAAGADPKPGRNSGLFDVVCGSTTYHAIGEGNGHFTPAHDLASNTMLIPLSFGVFTGTSRYPDGHITVETDPPTAKGQSAKQPGAVNCTYSFVFVSDGSDPTGPPAGFSFTGEGSVVGKITPAKG
jgi:hypothetical protein